MKTPKPISPKYRISQFSDRKIKNSKATPPQDLSGPSTSRLKIASLRISKRTIGCLAVLSALIWTMPDVDAATITYEGILQGNVTQFDSVSSGGTFNDPETARFWTFFGNQGSTVTIEALRLENDLDPAIWVFEGVFDDTSAFLGGSNAGFDTSDLGFLDFADDEIPNSGPFGDPRSTVILTLPGTGAYTIAVTNYLSGAVDGGDGLFDYQITATVVPEPSTLLLAALALLGIGYCRKRRA